MSPVSRAWQRLADTTLASLGISSSTGWALVYLQRLGDSARQADLARAVGVTEASLVRTLHALEDAGLVVRAVDKRDRRANLLQLTPEGVSHASRIDRRLAALRSELLDGVSDGELETTLRVLDTLAAKLADRRAQP
ncbi:MarR family winged helix-turn-helix transcriptional regulator [Sphingomonas sp. R1]|uniref:MarR family winged helix-turn-helix transcriptional regulator n=1 Tax=Sphingomonas sp. R1 TaxID=399176 RepID=UPI002224370F|nr:MarR family transcriptional regulator [Sphingomonas sp. R1]UYY77925.1 MarR family transcriptional regulator [Sphingomonas sp. R1]